MSETSPTWPVVLTIAGSDSGAGAGIQADLKTFAAFETYGTSVITAITAQNTKSVSLVHTLPPSVVQAQIQSICEDFSIRWAKTGMLGDESIVNTVLEEAERWGLSLVVDPVLFATHGPALLTSTDAVRLRDQLLHTASVITPNLQEAAWLAETPAIETLDHQKEIAFSLQSKGPKAVLIKGGHGLKSRVVDVLCVDGTLHMFSHDRVTTKNHHGTGCTLSAAITAGLAHGLTIAEATQKGIHYLKAALQHDFHVGQGTGPLQHFHSFTEA